MLCVQTTICYKLTIFEIKYRQCQQFSSSLFYCVTTYNRGTFHIKYKAIITDFPISDIKVPINLFLEELFRNIANTHTHTCTYTCVYRCVSNGDVSRTYVCMCVCVHVGFDRTIPAVVLSCGTATDYYDTMIAISPSPAPSGFQRERERETSLSLSLLLYTSIQERIYTKI